MGKQKISPEKMAKALALPTIYQFTLKEVSTANYDKVLNMLKQNAEQTVILERLSKHFSKEECKSFDSETLLSFRLTDAVMLNFKRIVKN